MNLLNNHLSIGRYAKTCAARADLGVQFKPDEVPHTSGKTIFLPSITSTTSDEQITHLLHYTSHEVGHVLYTDFAFGNKMGVNSTNSFLGLIWNIIEDVRVNYLNASEYEGDRLISDKFYYSYMPTALTKITSQLDASPDVAKVYSLMIWAAHQEMDMYPSIALLPTTFTSHPSVAPYYDKLVAGDYADVLRNIRQVKQLSGTQGTYELSKRIYEEVFGEDAKQEEQRVKQAAKDKGKEEGEPQEGGEGEGEPQEGVGSGQGGGKQGESEGDADGQDVSAKKGKGSKQGKPRTITITDYSQFTESSNDGKGSGNHIDYSEYRTSGDTYTPTPHSDVKVVDFTKETPTCKDTIERRGIVDQVARLAGEGSSKALATKLRTKLQIMAKAKQQYGVKKGKLHNANLYRVTLKDAKGYNERVFKTRIESNTLDTCVCVLVDTSGSMSGSKYSHAIKAATLINEAIGNVLSMPLSLMGFTTSRGGGREVNKMLIYRKFNNKRVPEDTLINNLAVGGANGMGSNVDGEALVYAYDELMRQPQKRKVLIVLSDGSPAGGHRNGDIVQYTQDVIKAIEERKEVDLYAIGIMDRNVTRLYKKHVVVNEVNELESTLLSVLDKSITQ